MGITRSNLHKRRATGAKRAIHRKKRKYELGRPASNTKLSTDNKVKDVRVRGGNYKRRALRLSGGNFAWGSEGFAAKTRILDVVYNASNNELTRTKTLVKGAIVQIDASPFKQFFEEKYNQVLNKTKEEKVADKVPLTELKKKQKQKIQHRREGHEIEELLRDELSTGRLLAILSSRPGQVGRADGRILEGPELAFYLKKIQQKRKTRQ